MSIRLKLAVLADAAKYDASCASSGSRPPESRQGPRQHREDRHLPQLYPRRPLRLAAENPPHELLHLRLSVLCQPRLQRHSPRPLHARRSRLADARVLPPQLHRRPVPQLRHHSKPRLHDGATRAASPASLRETHEYNGYIHLKAVPGGISRTSRSRPAATPTGSARTSSFPPIPTWPDSPRRKNARRFDSAMAHIRTGVDAASGRTKADRRAPQFAPAGQSTQMIVGATASTDAAILATASDLYRRQRLRRVYYSAFSPIPKADDRLPAQSPPLVREHRLYQADWLVPLLWLLRHRADDTTPSQISTCRSTPSSPGRCGIASFFPSTSIVLLRESLLRIPGLGVRNVGRILTSRRFRSFASPTSSHCGFRLRKSARSSSVPTTTPTRFDRSHRSTKKNRHATKATEPFRLAASATSGEV